MKSSKCAGRFDHAEDGRAVCFVLVEVSGCQLAPPLTLKLDVEGNPFAHLLSCVLVGILPLAPKYLVGFLVSTRFLRCCCCVFLRLYYFLQPLPRTCSFVVYLVSANTAALLIPQQGWWCCSWRYCIAHGALLTDGATSGCLLMAGPLPRPSTQQRDSSVVWSLGKPSVHFDGEEQRDERYHRSSFSAKLTKGRLSPLIPGG